MLDPKSRKRKSYGPMAERIARWKRDKDLVIEGRRAIECPTHIKVVARAAIALLRMGFKTNTQVAQVLEKTVAEIADVREKIADSANSIVELARRIGIPRWAAVALPYGQMVCCPTCNSRLSQVPCVRCGPEWPGFPVPLYDLESEADDPPPPPPTDALPGSLEKLEVLSWRFAAGYSLFHDDDRSDFSKFAELLKNRYSSDSGNSKMDTSDE